VKLSDKLQPIASNTEGEQAILRYICHIPDGNSINLLTTLPINGKAMSIFNMIMSRMEYLLGLQTNPLLELLEIYENETT
jgi:hypothetical protein